MFKIKNTNLIVPCVLYQLKKDFSGENKQITQNKDLREMKTLSLFNTKIINDLPFADL
jgi:hypothetical protein